MESGPSPKLAEAGLRNQLKAIRTRLGLSQAELAQAAGVTRQTIGGIEGALYAPSAAVALRLSRALGCRVEELFWLDETEAPILPAQVAGELKGIGSRVLLGKVGDQWIAHELSGESAFRLEMAPADGEILSAEGTNLSVRALDTPEALARTVLIAGCAPALSLWTRSAERWHPGLRPAWIFANSSRALEALGRGEVHIAGIHLIDPESGEENEPYVHRLSQQTGEAFALVNFGVWDEGFAVAPGNPLEIDGVRRLGGGKVRVANREEGSGGRVLLDNERVAAGLQLEDIAGYATEVTSHHAVARAVLSGSADCGIVPAALARAYNLDFVPLRRVRFDLVLREAQLQHEPVRQLLSTLEHRSVRSQLQLLGGLDTERSGEVIARVKTTT